MVKSTSRPHVNKIYIAIHQGYTRIIQLGGHEYEDLTPTSFDLYNKVKQQQSRIIEEIKKNPKTALFVLPCFLPLNEIYEWLPFGERNILESELRNLAELATLLGNRFFLLSESYIEHKRGRFLGVFRSDEILYNDPLLQSKLSFTYNPRSTKVTAFGEYTSHCVSLYGQAMCKALGVPQRKFRIEEEASIENIQLIYDLATEPDTRELLRRRERI